MKVNTMDNILIIGPSGAVGVPLIKQLVGREIEFSVLTSSRDSAEKLSNLGVSKTILGDWHSTSDLANCMKDIKSVCYIPARFKIDEFTVGKSVVNAAKTAKVDHFCFLSAYHSQMQSLGHHWQKLLVEEYLIGSDLKYTVVQPSMFMQNIRVEWPSIVNDGIYSRPYSPKSLMNVIDTDDLGEALANILTNNNLWGATYELCGSKVISHNEMASIIGDELGKTIRAVQREIGEWKKWAEDRGWSEYAIENYVKMCNHYDKHGYKYGNDIMLTTLLGRPPINYQEFIRKFIKQQSE